MSIQPQSAKLALGPGSGGGADDDASLLVDALPYIDAGYDEHAKQAALSLIEAECVRFPATTDYLANLLPPEEVIDQWSTDILRSEMERVAGRHPMEMLSMKRYELPGPATARLTDVAAWTDSVSNARAQLQHQHARLTNLSLLWSHGGAAWRAYNTTLERLSRHAEQQVRHTAARVQDVHVKRKHMQLEAGAQLKRFETEWVQLVSKNFQIESACADIEHELGPLRKRSKSASGD